MRRCPCSPGVGRHRGVLRATVAMGRARRLCPLSRRRGILFYLFAPKRCDALRRHWTAAWPAEEWRRLRRLRACYREAGVAFGVGLSPYALVPAFRRHARAPAREGRDPQPAGARSARHPLRRHAGRGSGSRPAPGRHRGAGVRDQQRGRRGPVPDLLLRRFPPLDAFSGPRPPEYLETLGTALPSAVHVFWTRPAGVLGHHRPAPPRRSARTPRAPGAALGQLPGQRRPSHEPASPPARLHGARGATGGAAPRARRQPDERGAALADPARDPPHALCRPAGLRTRAGLRPCARVPL